MKPVEVYTEYCTGCGLCHAAAGIKFERDETGFNYPILQDKDCDFLKNVCPAGGKASRTYYDRSIWGHSEEIYLGWSTNNNVRRNASSGGVITEICQFLLKSGEVDGVIQTKIDPLFPYRTETVVNYGEEDILGCMGSRYCESNPLYNIFNMIEADKKYAFVGKPCDVSALRLYMEENEFLSQHVKYLISFFCAGVPSEKANLKLLSQLGATDRNKCIKLKYRGNGWPGKTTCLLEDGEENAMTYAESWGSILGRDIRTSCRVCLDGIGELADISCGDAWYTDCNGNPDFGEHDGRNLIFARTKKGNIILRRMMDAECITIQPLNEAVDLYKIQTFQYMRRACMSSMMMALKICGRPIPYYDNLRFFSKQIPIMLRMRRFLGTLKRIKNGKF